MSEKSIGTLLEESRQLNSKIDTYKSLSVKLDAYSKGLSYHCGPKVKLFIDNGYGESTTLELTEQDQSTAYGRKATSSSNMVMLGLKKMLTAKADRDKAELEAILAQITAMTKGL